METLESLVERAQSGDQNAYGEIVRRFQDMAYGYAYAILGDFQLAEDAAQEAFIEAYHCLPNLREPRAFPGWFKRVVFGRCNRLIRGKRVETVPIGTAQAVARDLEIDVEFIEAAEAVVAPGPKDYDMGVPSSPVSAESAEAVDVSDTYYAADYVVMAAPGSPFADSESLADLRDARVTAAVDAPPEIHSYIDDVIAPTTPTDPILGVPTSAAILGKMD